MESRREFLGRGLYVAPVILTVAVRPAFAGGAYGGQGGSQGGTSGGTLDGEPGEPGGPGTVAPQSQGTGKATFGDDAPWWAFWRRF